MDDQALFAGFWETETKTTRKVIARIPEGSDYRPDPKSRTAAEIAWQPLPPGIKEVMQRFKQVMTIENNWSDDPREEIIDESNRRYSALAMLLRARYLVDVDCWTEVRGQPIKPGTMCRVIREKLNLRKRKAANS